MDGLSRVAGLIAIVMMLVAIWYPGFVLASVLMALGYLLLKTPSKEK